MLRYARSRRLATKKIPFASGCICGEISPVSAPDTIRKKVSTLPHKPGIYLMKDRFGTVIYVGKARDLRKRVSHYFQPSRRMGWDLKFRALVEAICDFDFYIVRSEPEALLLESKLIKEFHPRYNVSFRDDKRYLMVKVNFNDPIPRFTLTRITFCGCSCHDSAPGDRVENVNKAENPRNFFNRCAISRLFDDRTQCEGCRRTQQGMSTIFADDRVAWGAARGPTR